jgi:hypothetical protein
MFEWLREASTWASRRKRRETVGVGRKGCRKDLQGDLAIELAVAGAIDLPIPPAPRGPRIS